MDFTVLESRLAPIITQLLQSPEVKKNAILTGDIITSYILEIIKEEAIKTQTNFGFSRYVRLAIKKFKEMFHLDNTQQNANTLDTSTTLNISAPVWSDTRTQGELAILSEGIKAMTTHESWPQARDNLVPQLVNLLVNYGLGLAASRVSNK